MAEQNGCNRTRCNTVRHEVLQRRRPIRRGGKRAGVDFFKQPFVAGKLRVGQLHIDYVPGYVLGFDLNLDLGDAAIVIDGIDLHARLRFKRLVIGFDLAFGVGATP